MTPADLVWLVGLFVLGLVFGSFGNVVIWRLPRKESVVSPGSHCPGCGHEIRWYDNVPVVSWLLLRARCRDCGEPIAWRYPAVEVASGVLWVAAGLRFGLSLETGACVFLFYVLLLLTAIDIDTMRLPNVLVLVLAVTGAVGALVAQIADVDLVPLVPTAQSGALSSPLLTAVVGAALGAGVSGGIAALYSAMRGRTGLGIGDVKLLGAMGLFVGPYVLLTFVLGSAIGAVWGVATAVRGGEGTETRIPFGPFLAAGCVVTVLAGPALVGWYLGLLGA